ncbi:MAG TPA: hypothetical protein VLM79_33050, partial [Kofleriaceae bacterium]|nr:hypothetical protein [Kofleriaceae bacterium]
PEQCQAKPVDRRSDVFSLGILLYELTTLTKLFRGGSDFALLKKIVDHPIEPPSKRLRGYPLELEGIVLKALAKAPEERYQTAQALQLDLEAFARERKLALSSVGVSRLVGSMFKRHDAWIRAQRAHSDHFIEVGATPNPANGPAFLAVGSEQAAPGAESAEAATVLGLQKPKPGTGIVRQRGLAETVPVGAALPRRRSGGLWLAGAILAASAAGGATIADRMTVGSGDRVSATALAADAERISSLFDGAARSAHIRADGIATTPMLRAAIETDAATLKDLANTEMIFTAGKGEALEVYQFGASKTVSLLRIPAAAPSLPALKGRETRVKIDGRIATVYASAPIAGYQSKMAGGLVIASPVDLAPIQRALEAHTTHAVLTGLGSDLALAGQGSLPAGVVPLKIAVPSTGDWSASGAVLIAAPGRAVGLPWARPVRNVAGGLAALFVLGFVVSLVRRPRSQLS